MDEDSAVVVLFNVLAPACGRNSCCKQQKSCHMQQKPCLCCAVQGVVGQGQKVGSSHCREAGQLPEAVAWYTAARQLKIAHEHMGCAAVCNRAARASRL
jgi:hypothetical protein